MRTVNGLVDISNEIESQIRMRLLDKVEPVAETEDEGELETIS